MAQSIALSLTLKDTEIKGESSIIADSREGTIECLSYSDNARTAREESTGSYSGRATHEPFVIVKRIDRSTPFLAQGLAANQEAIGTLRFYRPSPEGDGRTQQFFTISFKKGRISHIRRFSPDVQDPASANRAPYEEIGFVAEIINWKHEIENTEFEWDWSGQN